MTLDEFKYSPEGAAAIGRDGLQAVWDAAQREARRDVGTYAERRLALLREAYQAVCNDHLAALGTRVAKPHSLKARILAELDEADAALAKNPDQRQGADSPASATTDPSADQGNRKASVTTPVRSLQEATATPGAQSAPATLSVISAPSGWKLVPVEATKRMTCEAFIHATLIAPDGWSLGTNDSQEFFGGVYQQMLKTAPEPPAECHAASASEIGEGRLLSCGVCRNTGKVSGETCSFCKGRCDFAA